MFKNDTAHSAVTIDAILPPFALNWGSSTVLGSNNAVAYSSPVMWNGKTYIGCIDGSIYAFNGTVGNHTNAPLWHFKTNASIYGSAAVTTISSNDYVFIGSVDGNLYCFNASTNPTVPLWTQPLGGPIFTSPLILSEGTSILVVCASHSGILSAYNVTTPASPTLAWSVTISSNYLFASPAYDSTNDLVLEPSYDGNLYALKAGTGATLWSHPVTVGPTRASPAVTGKYLYNLSNSGILSCINKATGAIFTSISIGAPASSSPAVFRRSGTTNDTILTCGLNGMVEEWTLADPASNFEQAWKSQLPDAINSSPAVVSSNINNTSVTAVAYVGCNDGKLYTLNMANGRVLSTLAMGKTVQVSPAVAEGQLLVSSSGGVFQDYVMITSTPTNTPTGTFPTPTGTPTKTYTFTPTPTLNQFACPLANSWAVSNAYGAAFDTSGNIYVTDDLDSLVDVFNNGTGIWSSFGGPGSLNGQLSDPSGLAVDGSGNIYVVDSDNNRVEVFNSLGQYQRQWGNSGTGNGQFQYPVGIGISPVNGYVYVTDSANSRVEVFDTNGNYKNKWGAPGTNGSGNFETPWGIAPDLAGRIYVTDNTTGFVQVFDTTGVFKWQWNALQADSLQGAEFVAADRTGVVYVSDGYGAVGMFDTLGDWLGFTKGGSATFGEPDGLAVMGNSGATTLIVADWANNLVDRYGSCPLQMSPTLQITPAATWTNTPTATGTFATATNTPTVTPTFTPTCTQTSTPTPTVTLSPTPASVASGWVEATSSAAFGDRYGQASVYFNNRMWVIGGVSALTGATLGDIWSSADGVNWTQAVANAPFGPRTGLAALVYNNQLWVIGGSNGTSYFGDVWFSPDGANWTKASPVGTRTWAGALVYNNLMWVIGGYNSTGYLDDVRYSSDGVVWTTTTSNPGFSARYGFGSVAFNNLMWVIGGEDANGTDTDVWSSPDGTNWTRQSTTGPNLTQGACLTYNNQIYMIAGEWLGFHTGGITNSVYVSANGSSWNQLSPSPIFSSRYDISGVTANNAMWIFGGLGNGAGNDVWYSPPPPTTPTFTPTPTPNNNLSTSWNLVTSNAVFSPRQGQASVFFNNRLWVIGGLDASAPRNDVWSSWDGVTWQQATSSASFAGRYGHAAAVFNNLLWVFGGTTSAGVTNDLWYSADGVNWNQSGMSGVSTTIRTGAQMLVYNNLLWMLGGYNGSYLNDVYYSPDGVNWTQVTGGTPFTARSNFGSIVFNNQMWVIGGAGASGGNNYTDTWSSSDGITWTQQTSAGFPPLSSFGCLSYGSLLYALDGNLTGTGAGPATWIYISANGTTWNHIGIINPTPRYNESAVTAFGNMWAIGGGTTSGYGSLLNDVWNAPFSATSTPTITPTPWCPANNSWTAANPVGLAMDNQSNVYVTDDVLDQVVVLNPSGSQSSPWGTQGINNGQFNEPQGIAVDNQGKVYVADSGNNRIQVFNTYGQYITQWGGNGNSPGQFEYPVGIAVGSGNPASVFVADSDNARIEVFNTQGAPITQFSGAGLITLNQPWGLALGPDGYLYATDFGNSTVDVFDPRTTSPVRQWSVTQSGNLRGAESIAVDGKGAVYVTDSFGTVGLFDAYGHALGVVQSFPQGNIPFNETEGIAVSSNAATWAVADWQNGQVYEFGTCPVTVSPTPTPTSTPTTRPSPCLQLATTIGSGSMGQVSGVVADNNYVYESEWDTGLVREYSLSGVFQKACTVGGNLNQMKLGPDGNLYIVQNNNQIIFLNMSTCTVSNLNLPGATSGSLAFDPAWNLYLTDYANNRVLKYSYNGSGWSSTATAIGTGVLSGPEGVAVDTAGNVYVADTGNHRIEVLYTNGATASWGTGDFTQDMQDLRIDGKGYLWVDDREGNRVLAFDMNDGQLAETIGPTVGSITMNSTTGLAFGPGGQLFVGELGNQRVDRLDPCSGAITPTPTPTTPPGWYEASASAPFSGRINPGMVYFNNQFWIIGGKDSTIARNDVWYSGDGSNWKLATSAAAFSPRYGHQALVYNGKIWVMGGYNGTSYLSDTWCSKDGVNWTQASNGAFPARANGGSVVYGNQMWLIGGAESSGVTNDVWYSMNGSTWSQASAGATFSSRENFGCAVFNGKIWVIGGQNSSGGMGDVYSSSDGSNWTQATSSAAFGQLSGTTGLAYNGQLYAVGGTNSVNTNYDVWSSPDGTNWNPVTVSTGVNTTSAYPIPTGRSGQAGVVANNQMWVIGGSTGTANLNDVWYWPPSTPITPTVTPTFTPTPTPAVVSSQWSQATSSAAFSGRYGHASVFYNNKLWVIGGLNGSGTAKNDVWYSADGVNWTQATANAAFPARYGHQVLVYNNMMWLIGGYNGTTNYLADVWYSSDGVNWTQAASHTPFGQKYGMGALVFNNKMWLIGGSNGSNYTNDVWFSTDGVNWSQTANTAGFGPRTNFGCVVFNNQMWVMGGSSLSGYYSDIWSSSDGLNWSLQTSSGFGSATGFACFVYNSQIYEISGYVQGTGYTNGGNVSSDGIHWSAVTAGAFSARQLATGVVANLGSAGSSSAQMWLMGGTASAGVTNDVWYSPPVTTPTPTSTPTVTPTAYSGCLSAQPGNTWTPAATGTPIVGPGLVFNGKMWQFGNNGVFSSQDGTNWSSVSTPAFMNGRIGEGCVALGGLMYVIGGNTSGGNLNDVWSSPDGASWTQVTPQAAFSPRQGFGVYSFNNKMWVVGGYAGSGAVNDVWSSTNGSYWMPVSNSAGFNARELFGTCVFNNTMWVLGGYVPSPQQVFGDVWYSYDGSNWSEATASAGFAGGISPQVVACGNAMWLIGGQQPVLNGYQKDVWVSTNGVNWTETNNSTLFTTNSAMAFGGNVWVTGNPVSGNNWTWTAPCCLVPTPTSTATPTPTNSPTGTLTPNQSWTATPTLGLCSSGQPGNQWTAMATGTPDLSPTFDARNAMVMDPGDGWGPRLWIVNGSGSVYSSFNGTTWTLATSNAGFQARTNECSVAFNGKLWMVGGINSMTQVLNDVWSSSNGVSWVQVTSSAAFTKRFSFSMASFGGKMWVIGGREGSTTPNDGNDIWYSYDGANWYEATASPAFSIREGQQSFSFNNQLWVVGGVEYVPPMYTSTYLNDVWSSLDGVNWTQVTSSAAFSPRCFHQALACGNTMWVIGGLGSSVPVSDVWVSQDGANWSAANTTMPFAYCSTTSYNNSVWAFTGTAVSGNWGWNSPCCQLSTSTPTPTITPTPTWTPGMVSWRVHCAGGPVTDTFGNVWAAGNTGGGATGSPTTLTYNSGPIKGTADTELYNASLVGNQINYAFNVPAGSYQVLLKFAELASVSPYQREFNVLINGVPAISNLDIVKEVGTNTVDDKVIDNISPDPSGQIAIQWVQLAPSTIGQPEVCDIQIIPEPSAVSSYAWTQVTNAAPFGTRSGHSSLFFNSKIWVIGGNNGTTNLNDVWSSPDGVEWSSNTLNAAFSPRSNFMSFVYNGQMWVVGGSTNSGVTNDVWSSTDGVTWSQVSSDAGFSGRSSAGALVYNNAMWIIGGGSAMDVWASTNGSTWIQKTSNAAISLTSGSTLGAVVFNNRMWALQDGCGAWASSDGINWAPEKVDGCSWAVTVNAGSQGLFVEDWTSTQSGESFSVLNGQIFLTGGAYTAGFSVQNCNPQVLACSGGTGGFGPKAGVSTDGINWLNATPPFGPRTGHSTVVAFGKVWLIGGIGVGYMNDVWYAPASPAVPTATPTPGGMSVIRRLLNLSGEGKDSPTPTPTNTPTPTITPTPTLQPDIFQVVAAPNVSRAWQPVQFHVVLGQEAQVRLTLYSLTGEKVYQTTFSGQTGDNSFGWALQNDGGVPVASGMYIYTVELENSAVSERKMGKVVVIK